MNEPVERSCSMIWIDSEFVNLHRRFKSKTQYNLTKDNKNMTCVFIAAAQCSMMWLGSGLLRQIMKMKAALQLVTNWPPDNLINLSFDTHDLILRNREGVHMSATTHTIA